MLTGGHKTHTPLYIPYIYPLYTYYTSYYYSARFRSRLPEMGIFLGWGLPCIPVENLWKLKDALSIIIGFEVWGVVFYPAPGGPRNIGRMYGASSCQEKPTQ